MKLNKRGTEEPLLNARRKRTRRTSRRGRCSGGGGKPGGEPSIEEGIDGEGGKVGNEGMGAGKGGEQADEGAEAEKRLGGGKRRGQFPLPEGAKPTFRNTVSSLLERRAFYLSIVLKRVLMF